MRQGFDGTEGNRAGTQRGVQQAPSGLVEDRDVQKGSMVEIDIKVGQGEESKMRRRYNQGRESWLGERYIVGVDIQPRLAQNRILADKFLRHWKYFNHGLAKDNLSDI